MGLPPRGLRKQPDQHPPKYHLMNPMLVRQRIILIALLFPISLSAFAQVEQWLTSPQESARFEKQPNLLAFGNSSVSGPAIQIDEAQQFQSIDGFGFCLTGGSATHLLKMTP